MNGLIFDTSTSNAIIGILEEGCLKKVILLDAGRGLSSALFPAIAPYISTLSYIGVGIGPGSYMGTRTGATIAKTLVYAKGIRLVGFSSILVSLPHKLAASFVYVGDAKMGTNFLVEGQVIDNHIENLSNPRLVPQSELKEQLPFGKKVVEGENAKPHLGWATAHVNQALYENKTSQPEDLTLCYLR